MPPKLRTINYSESAVSKSMDEIFKYAFIARENAKKREEAMAVEGRATKRATDAAGRKETFALDLEKIRDAKAASIREDQNKHEINRYNIEQTAKNTRIFNEIAYKTEDRNLNDAVDELATLEVSLNKFGTSSDELNLTSGFPELSKDVIGTYIGQANVMRQNRAIYQKRIDASKEALLLLQQQGDVLADEQLAFAGADRVLTSDEYRGKKDNEGNVIKKGFLDWATTSTDDDYELPDGQIRKGLGWDRANTYGADFAFRAEGSVADREIASAASTLSLLAPVKNIISGESTVLKLQITPGEDEDMGDVEDRIEAFKGVALGDDDKKQLKLLYEVLSGIVDPIEMHNKIMEFSSNQKGDYNLDKFLDTISPMAWGSIKTNYKKYDRIEQDKLDSAFMIDESAAFSKSIESMTGKLEMFERFYSDHMGADATLKQKNFLLIEKKFGGEDLGGEYETWENAEIQASLGKIAGDDVSSNKFKEVASHVEAATTVEDADRARKTSLLDTREASMLAYYDMKDEMDDLGEDALTENLQENRAAPFNTKVFNHQMLETPENLEFIKEEAKASIDRFLKGGWSISEGFHRANDAQELLDLLIEFDKATTGKTQEEAEAEHSKALKALAKFK